MYWIRESPSRDVRVPLFSWFAHFWKFSCAKISAFSFVFSLFLTIFTQFHAVFPHFFFCLWPLTSLSLRQFVIHLSAVHFTSLSSYEISCPLSEKSAQYKYFMSYVIKWNNPHLSGKEKVYLSPRENANGTAAWDFCVITGRNHWHVRQYRGLAAMPCVRLRGRINLNFSTTYAVDCGA